MIGSKLGYSILLLLTFNLAGAQEKEKERETEKDSARIYRRIEEYSKKRGFTKFLHGLLFEPIKTQKKAIKARPKNVPKKNYRGLHGKIVRKINVVTLDPFGYSEKNTKDEPVNMLSRLGNRVHLRSKELTIRNLILVKRNLPLDSLLVKESERLIRTQRFIRGVVITPEIISSESDSVDVSIRVLDAWSLIPDVSGSPRSVSVKLSERNFLGLGHQFENGYAKNFRDGRDAISTRYTIPNLMNTYIQTQVSYQINPQGEYNKIISIDRPFFSPFARWAGGIYLDQQFRKDSVPNSSLIFETQNYKYNSVDLWGGHSYQVFRGSSEKDRTTNFISAVRYLQIDFRESPTEAFDPADFYSDETLILAGIGIASRQYVPDKFIFNYGIIEDVPVGRAFGVTGGYQNKNEQDRLYLGARAAFGKFSKWGYLSTNFEYGTFFNKSKTEQGAFTFQANYFTHLQEAGAWKFRQFVKARVVIGIDRKDSWGDEININESRGITGFNQELLFGTRKALLTFQTQAYAPWNLAGFRLNPFLNITMGVIGNSSVQLYSSKIYSQFGFGLIITNDYLVFSSFQLSAAFYPTIPGNGNNIFKTNTFNTEDFGFQDFEINKPRTVNYE